jgi:DNA-binding PadR family transcriptional regulator
MMLVLRVLARQPLHGYAIAQTIRQLSREELSVEEGSLYPALQKLLIKGWVKAAWRESESGRQVAIPHTAADGGSSRPRWRYRRMASAIGLLLDEA